MVALAAGVVSVPMEILEAALGVAPVLVSAAGTVVLAMVVVLAVVPAAVAVLAVLLV